MKFTTTLFTFLFSSCLCFGQKVATGEYTSGLKIAYDSQTNKLTGYYENYTGLDEATNTPLLSCLFYMEGILEENTAKLTTYYPSDQPDEYISGTLELVSSSGLTIKLSEEHGGCWNVQHFADEPATFSLEKETPWVQIRFIKSDKAFFYANGAMKKKQKSYVVRNDFVCIEKIEGKGAYCTFYGKQITKGWLKTADLN